MPKEDQHNKAPKLSRAEQKKADDEYMAECRRLLRLDRTYPVGDRYYKLVNERKAKEDAKVMAGVVGIIAGIALICFIVSKISDKVELADLESKKSECATLIPKYDWGEYKRAYKDEVLTAVGCHKGSYSSKSACQSDVAGKVYMMKKEKSDKLDISGYEVYSSNYTMPFDLAHNTKGNWEYYAIDCKDDGKWDEVILTPFSGTQLSIMWGKYDNKNEPAKKYRCVDVTSYDYEWGNDMYCTAPDGSHFYASYEDAAYYESL